MTVVVPWLELLFAPGCRAIEGTVAMVNETLRELDLPAEVSQIMVDTVEKARELRFLGSPSIRVNGHDVEAGAEERQDFGMGWRLYILEDGSSSKAIPKEYLVNALKKGQPSND